MARSFRIGIFEDEERFVTSVRTLHEKGFSIYDVFTPYPVHEVFNMLKRKTRLPTVAYFLGLAGACATLGFLIWACVISWPIDYGGKPFNSFPSFVVITIVITILFVAIGSLALFSSGAKLLPGRENTIFDLRSTDDRFVIVVEAVSPDDTDAERAGNLMIENGASEVVAKKIEKVIK
jgi:Alternative complex III, ActD subunit